MFLHHGPKSILSPIILTYNVGTASLVRTQQDSMWVSQHLINPPTLQSITFPPYINFEKFPWNQLWFKLWHHNFELKHLAVNSDLSSLVSTAAAPWGVSANSGFALNTPSWMHKHSYIITLIKCLSMEKQIRSYYRIVNWFVASPISLSLDQPVSCPNAEIKLWYSRESHHDYFSGKLPDRLFPDFCFLTKKILELILGIWCSLLCK